MGEVLTSSAISSSIGLTPLEALSTLVTWQSRLGRETAEERPLAVLRQSSSSDSTVSVTGAVGRSR